MPIHTFPMLFLLQANHHFIKTEQDITGYYQLRGVPETAAGFNFTPDKKFSFYFYYGAVDRQATGSFTYMNGQLILKGDKIPGKDFTVTKSRKQGNGFTLRVMHKNEILTNRIICIIKKGDATDIQYTNKDGIFFASEKPDSIQLIHPLYPDEPTVIKFSDFPKEHNYFELALQPQMEQISFLNLPVTIKDGQCSCTLPWLFGDKTVTFYKEEHP